MDKWLVIGCVGVVGLGVYVLSHRQNGIQMSATGTPLKLHRTPMSPYTHTTARVKVVNFFRGVSKWNPAYYNTMPRVVETDGSDNDLLVFNQN